ncbi:MAG: GTP-dependent dephospho-CoA kinase family protein [Halanaeroarchaeum sp.]
MTRIVATLPEEARESFKEPLGPVFEDAEALLESAEEPLIAVGDVVTYHLVDAGVLPRVSLVDGVTERSPVSDEVAEGVPASAAEVTVENPAGALSADLIRALTRAIESSEPTLLRVEGEEDLAVLPAVLLAPGGASVVYGQPGEGMVLVRVTDARRDAVRTLCGDLETEDDFWRLIDTAPPP